jgi:hypothetical protein
MGRVVKVLLAAWAGLSHVPKIKESIETTRTAARAGLNSVNLLKFGSPPDYPLKYSSSITIIAKTTELVINQFYARRLDSTLRLGRCPR